MAGGLERACEGDEAQPYHRCVVFPSVQLHTLGLSLYICLWHAMNLVTDIRSSSRYLISGLQGQGFRTGVRYPYPFVVARGILDGMRTPRSRSRKADVGASFTVRIFRDMRVQPPSVLPEVGETLRYGGTDWAVASRPQLPHSVFTLSSSSFSLYSIILDVPSIRFNY
jgi:hypothetical protein